METAYRPTPRTTPTRYRERAQLRPRGRPSHPRRVADLPPRLRQRGRPVVLPTTHARRGETLYLHGSTGQRPDARRQDRIGPARLRDRHPRRRAGAGPLGAAPFAGLPLGGGGRRRTPGRRPGREAAGAAVACSITSRPGRAADCRPPNARELAATAVLALDLVEVSAKVRAGGPADEPEDGTLPHWAGVLPLSLTAGTPVPADDLDPATPVPPYLTATPVRPQASGASVRICAATRRK